MKKAKYALVAVTAAFICILLGIFIGRNTNENYLPLPVPGAEAGTSSESTTDRSQVGKMDINTASQRQLMLLPGIGESIAQRIIDYRSANGPFASVEDLVNVHGIGDKKLEEIRDYITVAGG